MRASPEVPPVEVTRPVPEITFNFTQRGLHQDCVDGQQARYLPVDPDDLAMRLARHQSLFSEVLALVAPKQHAPVDPPRQSYQNWNAAGPANRRDAPTRLDDF